MNPFRLKLSPIKAVNKSFVFSEEIKLNNKKIVNSLTGTILNFYNCIIFFIGAQFYNNTNFLVILVIINISVYIFSYFYLLRKN